MESSDGEREQGVSRAGNGSASEPSRHMTRPTAKCALNTEETKESRDRKGSRQIAQCFVGHIVRTRPLDLGGT